jgi:uncharacterized protein (DUF2336 family)
MRHSRITTTPGFLDLVDVLGRGGTEEWRALYRRAQMDVAVRDQIRAALPLVDPEIGSGREIWAFLLEHIEQREARRPSGDGARSGSA